MKFKKGDRVFYNRSHRGVKITVAVELLFWNRASRRWLVQSYRGGQVEATEYELERGNVLDHIAWETKQ